MSNATLQHRFRSMVLGIRPSVIHTHGLSVGTPVDNLTETGLEAWQAGMGLLAIDLEALGAGAGPAEAWILQWVRDDQQREVQRWTDPSTTLRLLITALTGAEGAPSVSFWVQWNKNLRYVLDRMAIGIVEANHDTAEFALHCRDLVHANGGPTACIDLLRSIGDLSKGVVIERVVFRPLATPVERVRLAEVVAASFSLHDSGCTAVQTRFFDPACHPEPVSACSRQASRVRRLARPMVPGTGPI